MANNEKLIESLSTLNIHDHLCLIYDTSEEKFATVIPFIKMGLEQGDRCIYAADEDSVDTVMEMMSKEGIDVKNAVQSGALSVITKQEAYLKDGYFSPDRMINYLKDEVLDAKAKGFRALRVTGEMTWALGLDVGAERLMEYESKLNYFMSENDALAICQYNKNKFSPETIYEVINTHPLVIYDSTVGRNPYYSPPEEFLMPGMMQKKVDRLLNCIRDRESSEDKLKKNKEFIKGILESVDEGFIVIDRDMKITSANRAYCERSKISCDEIVGKYCYEVSHGLNIPCFDAGEECPVKYTFDTGKPYSCIHTHYDYQGEPIIVEVKSFPMKDPSGNVVAAIEIVHDITERRKLEDQFRHAQKMEAIGRLTGGIAHDFNNILTAIIGYASLLEAEVSVSDPRRVYITEILSASDRASSLTQGLLAFSRKQVMHPVLLDLNEVVSRVSKLLERIIGEDIDINLNLHKTPSTVMADATQVEQILMNLATNARDAMPEGGTLTISTDIIDMDREYVKLHGYGEPGRYAVIEVEDNGTGMEKATVDRIFEPFFTTKDIAKGTGLGLSIVYGIIKQHEGYINVYSEKGKGTTFKIYLPLSIEAKESKLPVEIPAKVRAGTETVLVAEDDQNVRKLVKTVLERAGYAVIEASNGEEAVLKFNENADTISICLIDIIMPKIDGKKAFEEIKKTNPKAKAIFTSGYTAEVVHKRGMLEEGADFIYKPISPTALLQKIREVLDR